MINKIKENKKVHVVQLAEISLNICEVWYERVWKIKYIQIK